MTDEIPIQEQPEVPASEEPTPRPVIRFDRGVNTAQVWMSAFLIVAAGVIAYSNVLGIPFHAEDQKLIVENAPMHALTTFTDAVDPANPRVLTLLSYALNWTVAPGSAASFHVVNLLLHLLNGVLVFLVCRALLGAAVSPVIPMVAGMLFVVHPLTTESVDYIVGRAGLLSACFALLATWLFLRSVGRAVSPSNPASEARAEEQSAYETGALPNAETGQAGSLSYGYAPLILSLLAYVLAWAADGWAIVLPVLILAADWVANGRGMFRRLRVHAAFWGVLGAMAAAQYGAGVAGPALFGKHTAFALLARLSVLPRDLCVVHAPPSPSGLLLLVPVLVLIAGVALTALRSVPGFGLLWFGAGLWCAGQGSGSERDAYAALAGLMMLVPGVIAFVKLPPLRAVGGLVAAALVIVAGAGAYTRNMTWRDPLSLWGDAVTKAPDSAAAARNLGHAYLAFGDVLGENPQAQQIFQEAESQLRRSVSLDAANVQARSDLAGAVARQARVDDAIPLFMDVLRLDIENAPATVSLALLLNEKASASGEPDLAARSLDYFRRADGLAPLAGEALSRYGMALLASGDWEGAASALQRAVGGDEKSPLAPALKNAQETLKTLRGMEQLSAALLSKDPADFMGLKMRAQALSLRGQSLGADYVLERLWRENRQDFAIWILTGLVKARMKATDDFLKGYPVPAKPADVASPWTEVARACASRGQWNAAKAYLESPGAAADSLPPVLLVLADIAQELRQGARLQDYLQQATKAYPNDPRPWLRLCDLATTSNATAAARFLGEAQARGADASEIAARKDKLGGVPVESADPGRTMIR